VAILQAGGGTRRGRSYQDSIVVTWETEKQSVGFPDSHFAALARRLPEKAETESLFRQVSLI